MINMNNTNNYDTTTCTTTTTTSNNTNNFDAKEMNTACSETEYSLLFRGVSALRGLSTFEPDNMTSLIEGSNGNGKEDNLNSEKTVPDLTDLLWREQNRHEEQQINKQNKEQNKVVLSQMNPVYFETTTTTTHAMNEQIKHELPVVASNNHQIMQQKQPVISSPVASQRRINLKRLSTASSSTTNSSLSVMDSSSNTSVQPSKRGRKPNSQNGASLTAEKAKLIKKQLGEVDKPTVYFGNKVVVKDTDEYVKRRENNNVAVKKCREKSTQKQQEREARMNKLESENKRLSGIVESQMKELNVLKNILIQMSPMKKLPEHIESLLKTVEH